MKLPAFQFYPGDWLKDPALRCCSLAARGLWIDLLCFMFESPTRGELRLATGLNPSDEQAARMCSVPISDYILLKEELKQTGVMSDKEGILICRRMKRDDRIRVIRSEAGSKGGSPRMTEGYNVPGYIYIIASPIDAKCKIGISRNPKNRLYRLRHDYPQYDLRLSVAIHVNDMGESESHIHEKFSKYKEQGEWFAIQESEAINLLKVELGKTGGAKAKQNTEDEDEDEDEVQKKKSTREGTRGLVDSEWLARLEHDETYKGIDVKREFGKMTNWCREHRVEPTRRRFINWLNRADRRLDGTGKNGAIESGRGLGTANEGKSSQYAGVGKVGGVSNSQRSTT